MSHKPKSLELDYEVDPSLWNGTSWAQACDVVTPTDHGKEEKHSLGENEVNYIIKWSRVAMEMGGGGGGRVGEDVGGGGGGWGRNWVGGGGWERWVGEEVGRGGEGEEGGGGWG